MGQSLRALEEAWRRNPEATFVRLAGAYREHGRLDDAIRVVERGLTRRPGHLAGRVLLARVQLDRGELAESEAVLDALLEDHPDHWEAGWMLARVRRAGGRREDEREALLRLRALHPGHQEVEAALRRIDADLAFRAAPPDTHPRVAVDPDLEFGEDDATQMSRGGGAELGSPPWVASSGVEASHSLPGRVAPPARDRDADPFMNATMAELLLAQGDPEGAREMYRALVEREPDRESFRARFVELGGGEDDVPEGDGPGDPDAAALEELLQELQ